MQTPTNCLSSAQTPAISALFYAAVPAGAACNDRPSSDAGDASDAGPADAGGE